MKKYLISFILFLGLHPVGLNAQNYILDPYNLDVTGMPGDFLLASLAVSNPGTADIVIFINRIVKNLPPGWTSCFCYPMCVAPLLDTLTWTIPAGTSVDISPNFQTTITPGFGIVRVELLNLTSGSVADTITFTGSTMSTGITEIKKDIQIFPNPVNDKLFIESSDAFPITVSIFDSTGKLVYHSDNNSREISFANFPDGNYNVRLLNDGQVIEKTVTVLKR